MPALHLLGLEPEFIVYMLRRQDIPYPSVSSAKPNPINTLWVTDTLAEAQHFRMLNNGSISHHINCWRRLMNHMLFTGFLQSEYCHQNITIFTHVSIKWCNFQCSLFPVFELSIYLFHMVLFWPECTSFSPFQEHRFVRVQGPTRFLGFGPGKGAHGTATAILS